jgi:ABC-type glycerol-3-phosphate transport system substrate-binding protein
MVATPIRWEALIMKKIILAALTGVLLLSLTACAHKTQDPVAAIEEDAPLADEITISCYDSIRYEWFLSEAAELFEQKYPGTKINIDFFSKMPDTIQKAMTMDDPDKQEQEVMDYISRLNTQLMSGQGPDILTMGVLPYYKYAESGFLDDLTVYMNADESFDISEYHSNIINGVRYKGGQYIMPMGFDYYAIIFDKSKLNEAAADKLREKNKFTYQELAYLIKDQLAQDGSDMRAIRWPDVDGLQQAFKFIFEGDYKKYVDLENKKAHFTDGDFVVLLNELKEQRESGYFGPKTNFPSLPSWEQEQDYYDSYSHSYYVYEKCLLLKRMFDPDFDPSGGSPVYDVDEIAGLMTNGAGEAAFTFRQAVGINANSKNKALAWAFIKFMLSGELQQSINIMGFPVNKSAFIENAKIDLIKITHYVGDPNKPANEYLSHDDYEYQERIEEKYVRAYEDYLKVHTTFANELDFYPITDRTIWYMVKKEVDEFFYGHKSAEMVADILQNKVDLYLNE